MAGLSLLGMAGAWQPARAQAALEPGARPVSTRGADALRDYAIRPGPLAEALSVFGAASGIMVGIDTALTRDRVTPGLNGRHTVRDGLARLLAGTGLEAYRTQEGGYRLRPAPAGAGGVSMLAPVHVEAREDNPADAPYLRAGSGAYLSQAAIERDRGSSVGDIFRSVPGVLVGENRNSGGLDVNIRGMQGQGRVPVLVDGARQETTVYRGYSGVSSRSYIDPDLIGGIEIEKGVTLNAQSAGAIGGMVSMRTLRAEDIVQPGKTFGIRLRGSATGNSTASASAPGTRSGYQLMGGIMVGPETQYRTNCATVNVCQGSELERIYGTDATLDRPGTFTPRNYAGSVAIAQRLERVDLVAAYARRSQGNYYAGTHGPAPWMDVSETYDRGFYTEVVPKLVGASRVRGGERVVNSNYSSESKLLKARVFLPSDQELELGYLRYDSEYSQLMPSQLLWFGMVEQAGLSEVAADTYTARYRWNPGHDERVDLRANLWLTDTRTVNRNYSPTMALTLVGLNNTEKYRRIGGDLSNVMRFSRWGGMQLEYGASGQWERIGTQGEVEAGSQGDMRNATRNEFSAYAKAQWKPLTSVTLDAGLRYMRFRSHDNNAIHIDPDSTRCVDADGDGKCDPVFYENRASGVTPVASALWEVHPGVQLYASYAQAMRMPSLFESSSGFSVSPTLDADLRPEHAYNREFGLNLFKDGLLQSRDRFRFKLAYFRNTIRDYLTRTIPNTWEDTSTGSNAAVFRMRNIDRAVFHGVELSGSYDLGPVFTEFGLTRYTHIETCHTGSYRRQVCTDYGIASSYVNNMIPPRWHGTATVGARLFERALTVGVRGTFMGRRNPVPAFDNQTSHGTAAPVEWHAYTLVDLFASWRVNKTLSVDVVIDNLTDRYYLDALSLGLVPAPGRTARLSATLRF